MRRLFVALLLLAAPAWAQFSGVGATSNPGRASTAQIMTSTSAARVRIGWWQTRWGNSNAGACVAGVNCWGLNLGNFSGTQTFPANDRVQLSVVGPAGWAGWQYNNTTAGLDGAWSNSPVLSGVFQTDASLTNYKLVFNATNQTGTTYFGSNSIPNATPVATYAGPARFVGFAYDSTRSGNWWLISSDGTNMSGLDTGLAAVAATTYSFVLDMSGLASGSSYSLALSTYSGTTLTPVGAWTKSTNTPNGGWNFGLDLFAVATTASSRSLTMCGFSLLQVP